jgi:hypothetical protein
MKLSLIHLWDQLTEPHPDLRERDQRRLASLLSKLILGAIGVAIVAELVATTLINWAGEEYTGYRLTIVVVILFIFLYRLSRTRHYQTAALLTIFISTLSVFLATLAEPLGALGGLLDYVFVPLLLGSMFLTLRQLKVVFFCILGGLLLLPLFSPPITVSLVLIGPISFVVIMTLFLFLMLRTRNLLEEDRRTALVASEKRARQRLEQLQTLRTIDLAITPQHDLSRILDVLLGELIVRLEVDAALILILDKADGLLKYAASRGLQSSQLKAMQYHIGEGPAGGVAHHHTYVHVADVQESAYLFPHIEILQKESIVSYIAVPLLADNHVKGVLEVFHRAPLEKEPEWMAFLEALAGLNIRPRSSPFPTAITRNGTAPGSPVAFAGRPFLSQPVFLPS